MECVCKTLGDFYACICCEAKATWPDPYDFDFGS